MVASIEICKYLRELVANPVKQMFLTGFCFYRVCSNEHLIELSNAFVSK